MGCNINLLGDNNSPRRTTTSSNIYTRGARLRTAGSDIVLSEQTIADSGISLDTGEESGISLDLDDDAGDETLYEVPALTEDATDFDMDEADDSSGTGVLIFTDEEDAEDYTDTAHLT